VEVDERVLEALAKAFPSVETEALGELGLCCDSIAVSRGRSVIEAGSPIKGVFAIVAGHVVSTSSSGARHRVRCFNVLTGGDFLGVVPALLAQSVSPCNAVCLTETTLLQWQRAGFAAFLRERPIAYADVSRWLARRLAIMRVLLARDATAEILNNVALLLLVGARRFGVHQSETVLIEIPFGRKLLADLLGVSLESTHRALRELKSRGLVDVGREQVEVIDLDGLSAVAQASDELLDLLVGNA